MSRVRFSGNVPHKHPFKVVSIYDRTEPSGKVENLVTGEVNDVEFEVDEDKTADDMLGTYWKRRKVALSDGWTYERISPTTAAKQIEEIIDALRDRVEEDILPDSRMELQRLLARFQSDK